MAAVGGRRHGAGLRAGVRRVAAVYLPCYFRWGFGKGNVAAALILAGGIIASDSAGPAVAGFRAARGERAGRWSAAGKDSAGRRGARGSLGMAAGAVIVLALAAGVMALSAQAAARAYERQEF